MLEVLLKIGLAVLMIIGLVDVFRMLCGWLFKTKLNGKLWYVLTVSGHEEEAEIALRGAANRLKWTPGRDEKCICCVDLGMDEETREICRKAARDCPGIHLYTPEEWKKKTEQMFAKP